MIEILSRGRKGTLDWETERVSPRPLRSQFKLYQPVENSVNENCTASIDLERKFAPLRVIRITDMSTTACFRDVTKGRSASRNSHPMSSHHSTSTPNFTNKIVVEGNRTLILSACKACSDFRKCSKVRRLVGKMGEISSVQQRADAPLRQFIPPHARLCFHGFHGHGHGEQRIMR